MSEVASDEALLRAFVGARAQDYYLAYFARARARGYAPIAWHWPALFFGILWLAYRRLYPWALALFAAPYLAGFVAALADRAWPGTGMPLLWTVVLGLLGVWLPLYANALYYRHAVAAIAAARARHPGDSAAQRAWLGTRGGALPLLPFVALALALLLLSQVDMTPAP